MEQGGRMSKFWLPWLVGMPSETAVAMCSMMFGGVLERFPKLRVCFAHGGINYTEAVVNCCISKTEFFQIIKSLYFLFLFIGGAFPYLVGRVEHGFNVRPDLCATENPFTPRYSCCV